MSLIIVGSHISWANTEILGQGERASISIHDVLIETFFKAVIKHRKKWSKRLIADFLHASEGLKLHCNCLYFAAFIFLGEGDECQF